MYENEQYEMVWASGWDYYVRTRNVKTKEPIIRKFQPKWEYFVEDPNGDYIYILDDKKKLSKKEFYSHKKEREFRNLMDSVGRTIYGGQRPEYVHIREHFFGKQRDVETRIWFFDIEVISETKEFPNPQEAKHPITQIQIYDSYTDKIILLSLDDFKNKNVLKKYDNVIFKVFDTEKKLLQAFLKILNHMKPTVITAWNGDYFDFPYVTHRIMKTEGISHLNLSPVKKIKEIETNEGYNYKWEGIYLIDMMRAYKKFTYDPRASYALEYIANIELGHGNGKVDYGEFNDIIDFYHGNKDKFLEYAIQDVIVLKGIEDKLKLIELMKFLSIMMGVNYEDTFGTVNPWSQYITNYAYERKMILPYKVKNKLNKTIVGGYVRDPKVGKAKWIISIDVNSMYPLLGMRAFNMSPETYVNDKELEDKPELKEIRAKYHTTENERIYQNEEVLKEIKEAVHKHNVSYGINAFFKKEKEGIVPEMVGKIYSGRKIAKNKMLAYKALKARLSA